ncbi:MAG: glycosyltransferase family 9 protein [Cetobacterium sp.]|uniref:glycosyltransferase family 9 protein n=1 Tax=Cetobacterium sp. TaxID=2071632 RepID=UPI003F2A85D1
MLEKNINKLILICFLLIDFIINLTKKNEIERREILVVEFANIGDFILKIVSLKKLKKENKDKRMDLICDISCKSIAERTGYFDRVIGIDRKKFLRKIYYRYSVLKKLKKQEYEISINLFYSRNIFADDWIIKNIKSKEKIGLLGDNVNRNFYKISNNWYTKLIKTPEQILFETERTNLLVRELINLKFKNEYSDITNFFNDEFELSKEFGVIFLGASNLKRAYPLEKMIEVLKKIPKEIDLVFCGTEQELKLYQKLEKIYVLKNKKINLIGKTTLVESINIIKNSKFVIGNDSGPVHIAAALKKPSICILGGGMDIGRFFPYKFSDEKSEEKKYFLPRVIYEEKKCFGCGWKCKYKTKKSDSWPCISEVSLEKIQNELEKILQKGSEKC